MQNVYWSCAFVSVCLSVPCCIPTLQHIPDVTWENGVLPSCALIGWICNWCMGFVAMTT